MQTIRNDTRVECRGSFRGDKAETNCQDGRGAANDPKRTPGSRGRSATSNDILDLSWVYGELALCADDADADPWL
jgi:hypothetical protein